jgi:hypothetical protein
MDDVDTMNDVLPWLKPEVSYSSELTKLLNSGDSVQTILDVLIGINSKT